MLENTLESPLHTKEIKLKQKSEFLLAEIKNWIHEHANTHGSKWIEIIKGPVPRNLHHFPKAVGIILPLISTWNYPAHKI